MFSEKKILDLSNFSTGLLTVGVINTVFWSVGIFAYWDLSSQQGDRYLVALYMAAFLVLVGIIMILNAFRLSRIAKKARKYAAVVAGCEEISIEQFASILGERPKTVCKNLHVMIGRGLASGVRIDMSGGFIQLIPPSNEIHDKVAPNVEAPKVENEDETMVAVTCKSCCGITMLPLNAKGICDYCGSKIKS